MESPLSPKDKLFEDLFFEYYTALWRYACKIVGDRDVAQDLVMDLFQALWEKDPAITPTRSYLFTAVYHASLNWMRHVKTRERYLAAKYVELMEEGLLLPPSAEEALYIAQLDEMVARALDNLPGRCREIFELSRMQNLKNREIAQQLGISENTVERQMSIALRRMREAFRNWMLLLF